MKVPIKNEQAPGGVLAQDGLTVNYNPCTVFNIAQEKTGVNVTDAVGLYRAGTAAAASAIFNQDAETMRGAGSAFLRAAEFMGWDRTKEG